MSARVIGGSARGRKLKLVPGDSTRPIMDRVKESLFNIIGADILDATFYDMFAGTGSVGIEALSRGAKLAWFTDTERAAIKTIEDNLTATQLRARAVVRRADALALLSAPQPLSFDYIYLAPPQYQGLWLRALQLLDDNETWTLDQVIIQIDPQEAQAVTLRRLVETDQRRYGNTLLWFLAAP
jgi:16S rRNA (guanine966-N2)-methyltransferase